MKLNLIIAFILIINNCFSQSKWDWAMSTGGSNYDFCKSVVTDKNNNIYALGVYRNYVKFGDFSLTSNDTYQSFIIQYNKNNEFLNAFNTSGTSCTAKSLSIDNDGNLYITGGFKGTVSFGNGVSISGNTIDEDIFIAKFDNNLNIKWAKKIASNECYNSGFNIIVDNGGNIYLTGTFGGSGVDFGNGKKISSNLRTPGYWRNVFVAKFDNSGNCIWVKSKNYDADIYGNCIRIDSEYNVYISDGKGNISKYNGVNGEFIWELSGKGTFDLSNNKLYTLGVDLSCFDINKDIIWETKEVTGSIIKVSSTGDLFISGSFSDKLDLADTSFNSRGGLDIFVSKYNSNGVNQWNLNAGGTGDDYSGDLCMNENGVHLVGAIKNLAKFGDFNLPFSDYYDLFLSRIKEIEIPPACSHNWGQVTELTSGTVASGKVTINGENATEEDFVGAFVNGELRAVNNIIINQGVSYVSFYIQGEKEETVHFKVWDQSECKEHPVKYTAKTKPGESIGAAPNYLPIYAGNTLELTMDIIGNGNVVLSPEGGFYNYGDIVKLTPVADENWQFDGWTGDLNGEINPTSITMSSSQNITATFSSFIMSLENEVLEGNIMLYPNPVETKLFVKTNISIKTLSIYDVLGQKLAVYHKNYNNISMAYYKKGVYFVKVESDVGKFFVTKIVKK